MRAPRKWLPAFLALVIGLNACACLAGAATLPDTGFEVQLLTQLYMPDEDYFALADMVSAVSGFVRDDARYQDRGIGSIKIRVAEWRMDAAEAAELRAEAAEAGDLMRRLPEPNADGLVMGHVVQALIRGAGTKPTLPKSSVDALSAYIEGYIRTHLTILEPALTRVDGIVSAGKPRAILDKFMDLYMRNDDLVGWIQICGTRVNYPVMYTPEDSEYYLGRDFNQKETPSGTPFLDSRCDPDEPSANMIVHAHNMKDGTMFGTLKEYERASYWRKHPRIKFDLLGEEGDYEIFGMFRSKMYEDGEPGFRYYEYIDFEDERRFAEFVGGVREATYVDTGVVPVWGDRLLTLSTCSRYVDGGTFVVVARRLD